MIRRINYIHIIMRSLISLRRGNGLASRDKAERSISSGRSTTDFAMFESSIDSRDVTIVIPTLNEEQAIDLVIQDVILQGYENVLVIDGNSTDKTPEIVNNHPVKLVTQKGKGKTGAIKTAIENVHTPYFVLLDGDCSYSARDIGYLLQNYSNVDEVIGARTQGRENISDLNRLGNWALNKAFNMVFGTKLTDVCSGMYLLKTSFSKSLNLDTEGFDVEVEIASQAAYRDSINEVPIGFYPRVGMQKLHPFRDGFKILLRILRMGLKLYPLRVLNLLTMLLIVPGALLIGFPVSYSPQFQSFFIGIIFITLAIQGVTLYIVDTKMKRNS